jgi:hypothetical protein
MSDKRFGTIETIQVIFQHPDTFFDLIQIMDERKELSIPEHDLLYRVEKAIRTAAPKEKKRIHLAFRTENLAGSGLMSIDKKAGVPHLYFDDSLIQLIRICDRSLRQDLTNAKLKARLSSLRELKRQIIESNLNSDNDDFLEACQAMSGELNSVIRLIHGNIRDLELDVSKRMEDISGAMALADEKLSVTQHYNLLGQITSIHQRHILPTLEFLNPSIKLRDGENLHETLEALGQAYRSHAHYELADQVDRSLISLNETYKPIQTIAKRVQDFVAKNQRALRQHNAMEEGFEELRNLITETQTSHLNRIQMHGDEFVEKTGFMSGLISRNYPSVLPLYDDPSSIRLLDSDLEARMEDAGRVNEAPELPTFTSERNDNGQERDRGKLLYDWVKGMTIPETNDLMRHLHERLHAFVGGYESMVDLMEAMSFVMNDKRRPINVRVINRFKTIEDDGRHMIYRLRRVSTISKEENHV